ncbi:MAG: DUF6502 family protein [Steroidobacteraceae bacterium]
MKKACANQITSRKNKRVNTPASLHEVTADEVIEKLFNLFEHLGIDISGPTSPPHATAIKNSLHPLYPYASAIGEMLTSWHQDPQYLDDLGNPTPIALRGRRPSFHNLAQRSVPNLKESYLLSELERLGAVSIDQNNLIHVHMRSFPAYEDKRLAIQHTLTSLDGFIRTLHHNLDSAPSNSDQLFHRIARCSDFDINEIPALKIRVKRHGQSFLESFDNWLIRKASTKLKKSSRGQKKANVSIGVYLSVES